MAKKKLYKNILKSGGNIPVVAALIVLVAFIGGLLIGSLVITKSFSGGGASLLAPMAGSYADGYNAAKKKLADSGMFFFNRTSLSGQVSKTAGNEVVFTAPLSNPLDDDSLKTRTAVVTKDTVFNVYRQKSAEKAAQDQKDGQKEMADLRAQISSLQAQMSKCVPMAAKAGSDESGNASCQNVSKEYNDAILKMTPINQKMDIFEKIDNASLKDIKEGMNITVLGVLKKPAENQTAVPAAMMSEYSDISGQAKFIASRIDARETAVMAAPAAATIPVSKTPAPDVPALIK